MIQQVPCTRSPAGGGDTRGRKGEKRNRQHSMHNAKLLPWLCKGILQLGTDLQAAPVKVTRYLSTGVAHQAKKGAKPSRKHGSFGYVHFSIERLRTPVSPGGGSIPHLSGLCLCLWYPSASWFLLCSSVCILPHAHGIVVFSAIASRPFFGSQMLVRILWWRSGGFSTLCKTPRVASDNLTTFALPRPLLKFNSFVLLDSSLPSLYPYPAMVSI